MPGKRHQTPLMLLAVILFSGTASAQNWVPEGPAPVENGLVDISPGKPQVGAVQAIAPHPANADIMIAGSVNGGLWRTVNATAMACCRSTFMAPNPIAALYGT